MGEGSANCGSEEGQVLKVEKSYHCYQWEAVIDAVVSIAYFSPFSKVMASCETIAWRRAG